MGLLSRIDATKTPGSTGSTTNGDEKKAVEADPFVEQKKRIHAAIITNANRQGLDVSDRAKMQALLDEEVNKDEYNIPRIQRPEVIAELFNDIMGYGPIECLIQSEKYSEIMVNGPEHVYVEDHGKLTLTDIKFRDEAHLMNVIDRIVTQVGRHVDEASPMVDARLPDGSRVNAIIPPLSLVGPVLTIRKFGKHPISSQQLIEFGSLTPKMLAFLEACVQGKLNIIVSGGTGSGKTTLLNVLSGFIPSDERIVTIEDSAEVQLEQEHVITLESRPSNLEGKGAITIRDLVVNALRMRPDRIIVGEVRSGETLDMLQAMNTGHDGSLTTIHANTPRDSTSRIETMVMMSGIELPEKAIREQISSAIDLIVQQSRLRDGTRKVTAISELVGMEGDTIQIQDIFKYENSGKMDMNGKFRGTFKATGIIPHVAKKIIQNGVKFNNDWFSV